MYFVYVIAEGGSSGYIEGIEYVAICSSNNFNSNLALSIFILLYQTSQEMKPKNVLK